LKVSSGLLKQKLLHSPPMGIDCVWNRLRCPAKLQK
jgi:hypothetical protein